ncbi:MAG: hypothetical protein ACR2P7_02635 [bacterium]
MSEICFDNLNGGVIVNYFIWKKADKYPPGRNIWEYKRETKSEPRRCVSVNDLPIKIGDRLVAGYQIEGKRFGKHTHTCPDDIVTQTKKLERALFRIVGATLWDTGCKRSRHWTGQFLHNDKSVVSASRICFDNDNHGAFINYVVFQPDNTLWEARDNQALSPPRCKRLEEFYQLKNGDKVNARIDVQAAPTWRHDGRNCPKQVTVDFNSKVTVLFRATGWATWDVKCVRTNHINSADVK